nr:unnamed protein product [Meloidogyne enterolobii]
MEVRVLQAAVVLQTAAKAKPEERQHLPTLIDHSEPHSSATQEFLVADVDEVERMKRKAIAEPKRLFPKTEETELREVVTYLNGLHYVDKIDYNWIREMVRRVAKRRNCSLLGQFDWQINP